MYQPSILAARRAGLGVTPEEGRRLADKWAPEMAGLQEEFEMLGDSYYSAILAEVVARFPQ